MKYQIVIFIYILLVSTLVYSKERDSLIQLTPSIGDTISSYENEVYEIYPYISDFRYALLYIRDNELLVNHIYYGPNAFEIRDTVIEQKLVMLGNIRTYIHHKEKEVRDNYEPKIVTVITEMENYTGELLFVNDKNLVIRLTENPDKYENDTLEILTNNVIQIVIKGDSYIQLGMGIGGTVGFTLGLLGGLAAGDDPPNQFLSLTAAQKSFLYGITLGLVGIITGLIIGVSTSTADEAIEITPDYDFKQLKKYSKYPISQEDRLELN